MRIVVMFFAIAIVIIFLKTFITTTILMNYLSSSILQTVKITRVFTEDQLPPYPSNIQPAVGGWQIVNDSNDKFYVYSAFLEVRKEQRKIVRVLGFTNSKNPEKVWCRLWYRPTEVNSAIRMTKTTSAKIKMLKDHNYTACFILCPLKWNQKTPVSVSVVSNVISSPTNLLIINNNYNDTKSTNKLGICVRPIVDNYNEAMRILEFFEFNRILGVSHFTLYNHRIGLQVDCLLKDYILQGMVTILPWNVNIAVMKELYLIGTLAAFNDCLYRSMYRFSYLMFVDFDEYIIPRLDYFLQQLLHSLEKLKTGEQPTPGSYMFRNAFFYLRWPDYKWASGINHSIVANLLTLRKTRRKIRLNGHTDRSKYICIPEKVVAVGNHYVLEHISGYNTFYVPPNIAILHHYRTECELEDADYCLKEESRIDTTAFRYHDSLVHVVKERYSYLKKCDIRIRTY